MDYVYICRAGDNEELRYSIRSIERNLPDVSVWVVGYKPDWYSGNFIPVEDIGKKFDNIYNALITLCNSENISNEFVLMNDDFFITDKMDSIPVMHGGLLKDKIKEYNKIVAYSLYVRILSQTYSQLVNCGIKEPLDYDIHVPMLMAKDKVKELTQKSFFPRSMYGNLANVGGEEIKDVKTYNLNSLMSVRSSNYLASSLPFISTEDKSFEKVYDEVLRDMFPEPSSYEK